MRQGFWKVAAAAPVLRVADCAGNAERIGEEMTRAFKAGVGLLVLPELCLTGSTAGDLLAAPALLRGAEAGLAALLEYSRNKEMLTLAGLPAAAYGGLYNCAALVYRGELLGVAAQSRPAGRLFAPAPPENREIELCGRRVPFGSRLLFRCRELPGFTLGVILGEEFYAPISPAGRHATAGATVLVCLSAEPELTGSADRRRRQILSLSDSLTAGFVFAEAGRGESTSGGVYAGHQLIAENGEPLAEAAPFSGERAVSEIDTESLCYIRRKRGVFAPAEEAGYTVIPFSVVPRETALTRPMPRKPFIRQPADALCRLTLRIQAEGLARRIEHTNAARAVVALSGGLDSALALLATVDAMALLGRPAAQVDALSMPCFGTTSRTRDNAARLAEALGTEFRCIPITEAVNLHFRDIGLDPSKQNTAYENAQARERTQVAMDWANLHNGLVVGTGDLSEQALGWSTYNGDHMSMYGVNAALPKTLIREMVGYAAGRADEAGNPALASVLRDILATPISPELLPPAEGKPSQLTESIVGPYELHDFFLYHMMRGGCGPGKILRLARYAFAGTYDDDTLRGRLRFFCGRFFSQQFKRSTMPDGPRVGPVSLSPRGDWSMPGDAVPDTWLAELEGLSEKMLRSDTDVGNV